MKSALRAFGVAVALGLGCAQAWASVLLNFDDVVAGTVEGQSISGAPVHAYLAAYGITFSSTLGVNPAIQYGPPGSHATAPSPPNYFSGHYPASSYSYTWTFAAALSSYSFDTVALDGVSTGAAWIATAYSATNTVLSQVNHNFITGPNTPSATYTLTGPGIHHIEFFTDVQGFAGNEFKFDNVVLTAAVPVPATALLMLPGFVLLWGGRRSARP
jgi:hypothetical protein